MSDSSKRRASTRSARERQAETGERYAEARRHATADGGSRSAPGQKQYTVSSSPIVSDFELIPPLAKEFGVYGTRDVVERTREWALDNQLLLFRGPADRCVHGLYRMGSCAAREVCEHAGLDHTQIWVQHDATGAFLLTQPYVDEIPEELAPYGRAHGLQVRSSAFDGWYSDSTLAIRLSIPQDWPLWPIERDAAVVLHTQPISWPDPE